MNTLSLAEIVDIALKNNPDTRAAWMNARAAAAGYGAAQSAYLPSLNVTAGLTRGNEGQQVKSSGEAPAITAYDASANLSLLLFDFGGRAAGVDEARQALHAANWTHDAVIQSTILDVEVAYYNYAGAKGMLEANRASLSDAEENLKAVQEKHNIGLATIADVLQAQTAYSETMLTMQNSQGQMQVAKGGLALVLGYPATIAEDFSVVIPEIPADTLQKNLEQMVQQALAVRPDLLASRSAVFSAQAKARQARSALLPSLMATGSSSRVRLQGQEKYNNYYTGTLALSLPLFNGFSKQYNYLRAKAEVEGALEDARSKELSVIFQVYAAYSDFRTAGIRMNTVNALMSSAAKSEEVAIGRYKEGVGTILDLLSAQRALAQARAEQILAKLGWHVALAQLAHDIGILGLHGDNPLTSPESLSR